MHSYKSLYVTYSSTLNNLHYFSCRLCILTARFFTQYKMNINKFYKSFGRGTTTNFQLIKYAKELKIPNFHVCMRDEIKHLPQDQILSLSIVTNIHTSKERGVHWSALHITKNKEAYFFDSFGLPPTLEVINFLPNQYIKIRNTLEVQNFGESNCGQLSLYVLYKLNLGESFHNIIISLIKNE